MNQDDLDRISDNARLAAGLTQGHGVAALERAHAWLGNVKGASYEGGSGWRYDQGDDNDPAAIPNDPTGEAGTNKTAPDQLAHFRLNAAIGALNTAALNVTKLLASIAPTNPARTDEGPGEGWCESCYRLHRYLEPVAIHKDGSAKYSKPPLCSWCGSFKRAEKQLPPLVLVRKHLEGKRISEEDKEKALGKKAS